MRWAEISVEAAEISLDAVANVLVDVGCGGAAAVGSSASDCTACLTVTGYLPVDDRLEDRLETLRARIRALPEMGVELPSTEISVRWVDDEEWAEGWKRYLKPVRAGRIVVKPTWEEYAAGPGDVIVEIDPGMAFGTGHHQTTQLCLEALQENVVGGETVLDVGTGSGVLAIAAVKLAAKCAVAVDSDPVAADVARQNVERAGLQDKIDLVVADSPQAFGGQAQIVVANIVADVIIGMARELREKTAVGGTLIVSGIITDRSTEVQAKLTELGMRITKIRQSGEWIAITAQRDSETGW